VIALHTLGDRLNQLGAKAAIWPSGKPAPWELKQPRGFAKFVLQLLKPIEPYDTGPFPRRIARFRDLKDAIVVYPEIVSGNPLGVERVVRWLLYAPGFHTGEVNFGKDDLYFFYQEKFNDLALNPDHENLLRVSTVHQAYEQTNFSTRSGAAYIVRKGEGKILNQHPANAIKVDALTHSAKAEVFNEVKYFYSYDLYTMYSVYAALCGCISIVIPEPGVSRGEWYPEDDRRFGIAYGPTDEQWAVETRPALIERLQKERGEEDALVKAFIQKCVKRFR
jgi:hypothetical protein